MSERKRFSEPPQELSPSERPTDKRPPKPENKEGEGKPLVIESITMGKIMGMSLNDDACKEKQSHDGQAALLATADGIGGEAGGDLASERATETVMKYFDQMEAIREKREKGDANATIETEAQLLRKSLREANARVALGRHEFEVYPRMGTTCVALRITRDAEKKPKAILAHVGDSRAYVLHPDKRLERLTLDDHLSFQSVKMLHGEQAALRVQKVIDDSLGKGQLETLMKEVAEGKEVPEGLPFTTEDIKFLTSHLSKDMFEYYYRRPSEVVASLGDKYELDFHIKILPAEPGSMFILASDGIDGLTEQEIELIAAGKYAELPHESIRQAAQVFGENTASALLYAAKERQEEYKPPFIHPRSRGIDDTTVQVVKIPELPKTPEPKQG